MYREFGGGGGGAEAPFTVKMSPLFGENASYSRFARESRIGPLSRICGFLRFPAKICGFLRKVS